MKALRTQKKHIKLKPCKMEAIKAMSLVCAKLYKELCTACVNTTNYHRIKSSQNYQMLLTNIAQSIVRLVDKDMQSFFINYYFNKAVKYLVEYAAKNNISTVIVGDFSGSKHSINIGKANNQNFIFIP